jgi:hypothetical protein
MNENDTYRHEDIEALLMSKRFDELLPEERSFILQHVQDEAEYTSMREMLLQMHELSFDNEMQEPPESLHTALMHGFAEHAERERGYRPRFAPWMGWAIAAAVVGFAAIFFAPFWKNIETAEVKEPQPTVAPIVPVVPDTAAVVMPSEAEQLYASLQPAEIPPAPEAVDELYERLETVKSVVLTAQEEEVMEAPADYNEAPAVEDMVLDKAMTAKEESTSAAPAMAQTTAAVKDTKKVAAESETLASTSSREVIATQKKKRNPDVRKLSQSKHLMKLLRPAGE